MITRCVCYNRKFAELKKIAKKNNIDNFDDLKKIVDFGNNCERCHPYIKEMLKTGKTEFDVIIE